MKKNIKKKFEKDILKPLRYKSFGNFIEICYESKQFLEENHDAIISCFESYYNGGTNKGNFSI